MYRLNERERATRMGPRCTKLLRRRTIPKPGKRAIVCGTRNGVAPKLFKRDFYAKPFRKDIIIIIIIITIITASIIINFTCASAVV
jgi:hypothetical protein